MTTKRQERIRFSKAFWVVNTVKLFRRAVYYGVSIVIILYLSRTLGFSDVQAASIVGTFPACPYLLPMFTEVSANKIGSRNSMLPVLTLLTCGYLELIIYPTWSQSTGLVKYSTTAIFTRLLESNLQYDIILVMALIVCDGVFIRSVISGTAAKETTPEIRTKGFSISYVTVNIGAFSGKVIMKPFRKALGNEGLITLSYFSVSMTFLVLLAIWFFYKSAQYSGGGKTFGQIWNALIKVCSNGRLITLIIIITEFWMVQRQLYATMPEYVLRLAGEGTPPSWHANVDPLIIVLTINLVTQMIRERAAPTSMTVGMFIASVSVLCMVSGSMLSTNSLILGMRPVAFMMVVGIVFQGLAEMFISPRLLEYFSLQAPKGEEGPCFGSNHLHPFLSSISGSGLSGFLLSKYCPEPALFTFREERLVASADARYTWYYFGVIALVSTVVLIVYGQVVKRLDSQEA